MNKPLLIGQAPGPRTDPAVPLSGRCGSRLAELCRLEVAEFMDRFEQAVPCDGPDIFHGWYRVSRLPRHPMRSIRDKIQRMTGTAMLLPSAL